MSHRLKSLDNSEGLAGVAGLPQGSNVNGCDSTGAISDPAKTAENPAECRTSPHLFELIDKDGIPVASSTRVTELAEAASIYLPDQSQDPDRTGLGWDVEVVRCQP